MSKTIQDLGYKFSIVQTGSPGRVLVDIPSSRHFLLDEVCSRVGAHTGRGAGLVEATREVLTEYSGREVMTTSVRSD
jgi:hypothetical protein